MDIDARMNDISNALKELKNYTDIEGFVTDLEYFMMSSHQSRRVIHQLLFIGLSIYQKYTRLHILT